MRIVFITSKLNFTKSGGSIEEIDFIIRTLQKQGNEVTVVTAYSSANHIPDSLPYPVIPEQIKSTGYLGVQREVFALLKKYSGQADWFHIDAHLFMYGAGLWRLLGGKVPIVAFFNQFLTCWPQYISSLFPQPRQNLGCRVKEKLRWCVERVFGMFLANRIDLFSFVSPTLRGMYEDFGLQTNEKNTIVIGDPINFKKIATDNGITPDSYAFRNKHSGPITIFYSSRMSPGKGFDILLKGFSLVKNKENFKVILGGTGPEEQYVRQMAKDLGLEKYVEIPGWVTKEQLYTYYKTADIFIQADWWPAGTSISLLYALAFGLPSILPGGGGLQWNAQSGALYFTYRDCADLAEKIEELGSNHALREELSRNCFRRLAADDMRYEDLIGALGEKMKVLFPK
ncbi:MAG: glycosyltransferase [Candidatus Magasanikbacteria bacterium]|nr:glycosyltransferase [Candidatus Magasanikbacteria bacterium]